MGCRRCSDRISRARRERNAFVADGRESAVIDWTNTSSHSAESECYKTSDNLVLPETRFFCSKTSSPYLLCASRSSVAIAVTFYLRARMSRRQRVAIDRSFCSNFSNPISAAMRQFHDSLGLAWHSVSQSASVETLVHGW